MKFEVLENVNLLKKYHKTLVFDYTEYPTKSNWSQEMGSSSYVSALSEWLNGGGDQENSLFYVHTPFCEQLCYFCLCSKEITKDYEKVKDYLYNVLFKEIDMLAATITNVGRKPKFTEIYFGGGSPTYYNQEDFANLIEKIKSVVDFSQVDTFTLEVDPRRVDVERMKFYATMGVNRISLGIQDFDPEVQEEINRLQPFELVKALLTDEVRALFPVIAFDLLIGLPKQTPESIKSTMDKVVELQPTELQTMYVHYKPDVRKYMTRMVRSQPLPDFFDRKAIFVQASTTLLESGYQRAGFESYSLPNAGLTKAMDEGKAYYNSIGTQKGAANNFVAVGSSAHGVFGDFYFQNFYERDVYTKHVQSGHFPIYRGYKLNNEDHIRRDIIKKTRTYFEVKFEDVETKYGINFKSHFSSELALLLEFEKDGLVSVMPDRFKVTELGKHFSPQICEVFDEYANRVPFNPNVHVPSAISQRSAAR